MANLRKGVPAHVCRAYSTEVTLAEVTLAEVTLAFVVCSRVTCWHMCLSLAFILVDATHIVIYIYIFECFRYSEEGNTFYKGLDRLFRTSRREEIQYTLFCMSICISE